MMKKIIAGLTAGVLTACMTSSFVAFPEENTEQMLRVMPLGDSITDGFTMQPEGGYRLTLWNMLKENGYTDNIDFVGPNGLDSTVWDSNGSDMNHAGYSGYAIADIPNQRSGIYNFSEWLMQEYPADVVMLQIGTNDILSSALDGMDERLELLIDTILTYIPEDGLLYVSTIPYMDADVTTYTDAYTAEEMDKAVDDYNAEIREIVSRKQAEGKPIAQADINSVLTKEDLLDGVHPNATGYEKMGKYWYGKLTEFIDGTAQTPTETELSTEETSETEFPTEETSESEVQPIPPLVSYGDVNLDDTVNLQDVVLLQKYLLGKAALTSTVFYNQADLNQDGKVNIYDLILLKRQLLEEVIYIDDPVV